MRRFALCIICFAAQLFSVSKEETEKLKLEVTSNLPTLEGWCSIEKALHFIDLVIETKPAVCVELGAFGGKSVYPVAAALRLIGEGIVIAVDPWDRFECIKYYDPVKDEASLRWWGKLNIDFIYSSFLHMLQRFNLEGYVETLRKTSEEAEPEIEEIDIIHMDGNHSKLVSSLDVILYLPKVKKGGYIWMNDATWADRLEAVQLLKEACDVVKAIDNGNCILFRKR